MFFVHSSDIFRESISIHISQCMEVCIFFHLYHAGCKTADKQKFNQNIVQVFTDEYKRAVVDPVALSCEFKRLDSCFWMNRNNTHCSHNKDNYLQCVIWHRLNNSWICYFSFRLKCSMKFCIFIIYFCTCALFRHCCLFKRNICLTLNTQISLVDWSSGFQSNEECKKK